MPVILAAVLAVFLAAPLACGAASVLARPSDTLIEIKGGEGSNAWRLLYGTRQSTPPYPLALVPFGEDRAWFVHYSWLRLIDTRKGMVLGRWHFPGEIVSVTPDGKRVAVEVHPEDGTPWNYLRKKFTFDPDSPQVPYFASSNLLALRLPMWEADLQGSTGLTINLTMAPLSPDRAREVLPKIDEAVRRDPFSPWLMVAQGKLRQDIGDPRTSEAFRQAVNGPSSDFTELLPISAYLQEQGQFDSSAIAFERGLRDMHEHRQDPRACVGLVFRLVLYRVDWKKLPEQQRPIYMERLYRLAPYVEGAEYGWKLYADWLERNGRTSEANLWKSRAAETEANSFWVLTPMRPMDRLMRVMGGCFLAGLLYLLLMGVRYHTQVRFDSAARIRAGSAAPKQTLPDRIRRFVYPSMDYWQMRERRTFLMIVLTAWLAAGAAGSYAQGLLRAEAFPFSFWTGNYASASSMVEIQKRLSPGPERDLLAAMAHLQAGEYAEAERLYRTLPQFADAWNNLGVLLKAGGKESEAQQAFAEALRLNPAMAEAAFNLGRPTSDFWAAEQKKLRPGQPMVAPLGREVLSKTFYAASTRDWALRIASGPLSSFLAPRVDVATAYVLFGGEIAAVVWTTIAIAALVFALALVFLVPAREVMQAPASSYKIWEILFPGASPRWGELGALVFLGWAYLFFLGIFAAVGAQNAGPLFQFVPTLEKSWVLPDYTSAQLFKLVYGSWTWEYAAAAVLFLTNLAIVLYRRETPAARGTAA